jgi:peptidyl-prolyl cis-trans isomerase D
VTVSSQKSTLKQRLRNFGAAAIVIGLALVFALQFGGPQAGGYFGEDSATTYLASVYGEKITMGDLRAAFVLAGGEALPPEIAQEGQLRALVFQGLVERILLARVAREMGFHVDEDQVMRTVAADGTMYVSISADAPPMLPSGPRQFDFADSEGRFSADNLKKFIQYRLHRSIKEFAESQIEETLANMAREAIVSTVQVSEGEVWDAYVREKEKVSLKYVRFSPIYYRGALRLSGEEIEAWKTAHRDEVDAEFKKQSHRYVGLEKQVRARHILIKVGSDAGEEEQNTARELAEDLRKRIERGEDFAELARRYSQDKGSARRGGDLGYNPRGRMVPPFDEAQFSLEPGQMSDVVKTRFGFHIIKVEGIREGDVPEDEARREIAENLLRQQRAREAAKTAAADALRKLREGLSIQELDAELGRMDAGEQDATGAAEDKSAERDPLAPQVRDTQAFGRTDVPIPGPFDSRPLTGLAFELTEEKPLAEKPIQLGEEWFVYRLESRETAERADFGEDERRQLTDALRYAKSQDVLASYVRRLKKEALAANALRVKSVRTSNDASPQ